MGGGSVWAEDESGDEAGGRGVSASADDGQMGFGKSRYYDSNSKEQTNYALILSFSRAENMVAVL